VVAAGATLAVLTSTLGSDLASAAPEPVTIGADTVHDAAWTALYYDSVDPGGRVVSTVVQDVANTAYALSPPLRPPRSTPSWPNSGRP
jgi:hypothetical protein